MDFFPISLKLTGQQCLIVGGTQVAYAKAKLLQQSGAIVDVVHETLDTRLLDLIQETRGSYWSMSFHQLIQQGCQLRDYRLVICAVEELSIRQDVYRACENAQVLVNSVDDMQHSHFTIPAIVDRSPIVVSIASHGQSPVLTRQLRTQLEALLPQQYGQLAVLSGNWRAKVKQVIPTVELRRIFWEDLYQSRFREHALNDQFQHAEQCISQALTEWKMPQGEVYLVGAGPGDPELLTLKALRLMQQADVVIYDRLVSEPIMALCRRDAEKVYVGKARSNHSVPQESINALLIEYAKQGKRVCRLKGGDPFIFGRGGEEIEELFQAGITFQVVPGITAASGCSAYAGIPLTHRDYAQSVRFLTGHLKEGSAELPWNELIYENQTLVLYMGLMGLETICQKLIAHGQRADMPVALISKGTTAEQKVVIGTLEDIHKKVSEYHIQAPTLTIIGEVVKLREQLKWKSE